MTSTFIKAMPTPRGRKFRAIFCGDHVGVFIIAEPLGWLGVGRKPCGANYFFSRDPERVTTQGRRTTLFINPADGICIADRTCPCAARPEFGDGKTHPCTRVSVFMNVF